jgi:methionyl-tRNA formyltransferase
MTETIQNIEQEIDTGKVPEQIEVQIDPETGKFVEFHRETGEKVA